jgi:hypothetical protein
MKKFHVNKEFLPLLAIARQVLQSELNAQAPEPLDPQVWEELDLRLVTQQRVSLLVGNYASASGVSNETIDRVLSDAVAHTHAAFLVASHTTVVSEALTEASVRHLILKGVAWGALVGGVVSRGAGDIDVLVAPEDIHAAGDVFVNLGFRPATAMPDPAERTNWSVVSFVERERTYLGTPVDIDLHWRISPQRHLFPSFEELYSRHVVVPVGGRTIPTLSMGDALVAACAHVYIDEFRSLRGLIDIVRLVHALGGATVPRHSRALRQLAADVMATTRQVFPGIAEDEFQGVMRQLPTPTNRTVSMWNEAHGVPYVKWATKRDLRAAAQRFLQEARFDRTIESIPRFFGKRLLVFPPWTPSAPTATLGQAAQRRVTNELRRRTPRRLPSASGAGR